jgi:YVTN family beta-propeller protein
MRPRSSSVVLAIVIALVLPLAPQGASAQTSEGSEVSKLHSIAHIPVGREPIGIAVDASTNMVYVCNYRDDTVSVITGATNTVIATIPVGGHPLAVAADEARDRAYVSNQDGGLTVIDTSTNQVIDTIEVGTHPSGVAVDTARNEIFVTNQLDDTVSVVDGTTHQVVDTVVVGDAPFGILVDRPLHHVYVANQGSDSISAISEDTHEVVHTFPFDDPNGPGWLALDSRLGRLYVVGHRTFEAFDVRTGARLAHIFFSVTRLSGIAVDPIKHRVYVVNQTADTVMNIDGENFHIDGLLPRGVRFPTGIASNRRTRHQYVTNGHEGVVSVLIHAGGA